MYSAKLTKNFKLNTMQFKYATNNITRTYGTTKHDRKIKHTNGSKKYDYKQTDTTNNLHNKIKQDSWSNYKKHSTFTNGDTLGNFKNVLPNYSQKTTKINFLEKNINSLNNEIKLLHNKINSYHIDITQLHTLFTSKKFIDLINTVANLAKHLKY